MTFGIDVASSQRDIDFIKAKAEGVEFVIVKMGGFNVTPQYVAPHYTAQIDRVVAAGLPKGHYYLIGAGQSPEAQAEFFVSNLHRFDVKRDVLALDNEHLDSNGTRWGDADAARFIRRVIALTGIPAHRVWHYAGAGDYRATGAWPELAALGVRFWWAAYGSYPTGKTPDHEPSLAGSIPRWDVHQFTSRSKVAGYELDGNYTPHSINELFGGEVATEAQIRAWIAGYPRAWDQLCQALMWQLANRFGTVRSTPVSAILAYHVERQAGRMRTSTPPPGSFVYWDIGADGHVGFVMNGGRVLMASRRVTEELVNSDAGIHTVAGYTRASGADYLGWSYQNGGNTVPFSTSSVAGMGDIIIIEPEEEEDDMAQGAWYKVQAGDPGADNVFWQEKPNGPLIQVGGDSVRAFEANGNKISVQSYAGISALLKKWGLIERPADVAVAVGEVKVVIDYAAAADAIFDEQARRIAD